MHFYATTPLFRLPIIILEGGVFWPPWPPPGYKYIKKLIVISVYVFVRACVCIGVCGVCKCRYVYIGMCILVYMNCVYMCVYVHVYRGFTDCF